jgi:hypothetical protein
VHFADLTAEYEAVLAQAQTFVAGFPPLLRDLAEPLLPELGGATFSRIAALLPYWLADLLDQRRPPAGARPSPGPGQTEALGLANLLGWWSYLLQDQILDGERDRAEVLPLAIAFHVASVRRFQHPVPGDAAFWEAFEALSLASAEAHCWEQRRRFQQWADLDREGLGPEAFGFDDLDRLANRSALLQLSAVVQLHLHGYGQDDPLHTAVRQMLHHYAVGRQIGDDRTDWVDDLKGGRLNYVSARIARRMMDRGAIQTYAGLDVERMVGYFLYDDELFAAIQQVAVAACQRAAQSIAPYQPRYLLALVDDLLDWTVRSYQAALRSRRRLRKLLRPLQPSP